MRRQTWKGVQGYWRKHEYKLIRREQFYRPESDGSLSVNEIQKLQDFPVLVHYFCKHPYVAHLTNAREHTHTRIDIGGFVWIEWLIH